MAEYTISATPSGTSKKNAQSRNINEILPYDATKYKTVSSITRTNGVWCSSGGQSQSAVVTVTAQLLIGDTVYMTADPVTCKCYGTGPSADNYATTTFTISTVAGSNAIIAAWAAGTLTIKWNLEDNKSGYDAYFRDGQYDDTITIVGEDVPPTNYKPVISSFSAMRSDNGTEVKTSADTIWIKVKLGLTDTSCAADKRKLYLYYGTTASVGTSYLDLSSNIAAMLSGEVSMQLSGTYSAGSDWYLYLVFIADEETSGYKSASVPKTNVPLHINKYNCGVGIGGYSASQSSTDYRVDVQWPLYAHEPIYALAGINGGIQGGITSSVSIKQNYKEVSVTFPTAFDSGVTPMVLVCMDKAAQNTDRYVALLSAMVVNGSVTNTGFKVRLCSNSSNTYSVAARWIAFAI